MTISAFIALAPLLLGLVVTPSNNGGPMTVRRITLQDQTILRIPVRPLPKVQRFNWIEHSGPKCVQTRFIRGALLSGSEHVDLVLPKSRRLRATFDDDCAGLDFYSGFYLKTNDNRLCAKRDSVHSRIGGSCRIDGFKLLVPQAKEPPIP